jgi:hypothetical protein
MEKVTSKKAPKLDPKSLIVNAYIHHVLEHGKDPVSVYKFAKELKMEESEFYTYFNSFHNIKSVIWHQIFEETYLNISSQEVYKEYSVREKYLAFLFTIIEDLKKKRSYFLATYPSAQKFPNFLPADDLKHFKIAFMKFAKELMMEGRETEEVADRPLLTDKYSDALWLHWGFVFHFWLKDTSLGFEKTDAMIEKSVNLAFDLFGKGALDSFLDFAKFLFQNK